MIAKITVIFRVKRLISRPLEHDPVLSRQVNVFRKVYFRSERIADKTSLEYRHTKQLSALLAKQILQELKIDTKRVTPN